MKKSFLVATLFCVVWCTFAQTGPGGIGNTEGNSDLFLWLTPDNLTSGRIQTWTDQSGFGNDLSQEVYDNQPLVYDDVINGNKAVYFTRNRYTRMVRENFNTFPSSEISGFFTTQTNENGSQYSGLLSYATDWSLGRDDQLLIKDTDDVTIQRKSKEVTDNDNINLGDWNNFGFMWKKNAGSNDDEYALYDEGVVSKSGILEQDIIPSGGCFAVGGDQRDVNVFNLQFYTGFFGEIILFKRAVTNVERIIISNYLSAKFGTDMDLGQNFYDFDMFKQDDAANGNFDYKVAGIGRDNAGNTHTNSKGAGIVTISNPRNLDDNEYLFWGENQRTSAYTYEVTDIYSKRLSATWRVSERKVDISLGDSPTDIGGVDIELDLTKTSLPSNFCRVRLIVSNDNFTNDFRDYTSTINSDTTKATITNVNFEDGDYFTFEYIDEIVIDDTRFYNGSRSDNGPNINDGCFKLLVKNTADGLEELQLKEDAVVREIEIESGGNLVVRSGNYLQITDKINNAGEIRLLGSAQLLQTHTNAKKVEGTGKLYKDQISASVTNSSGSAEYKSLYWSSPVNSNGSTFTVASVLKDGTNVTTATSTPVDIDFIESWNGEASSPIKISSHWLAKLIDGLSWTSVDPGSTSFSPGEAWNMKSTSADNQNFTFVGIPNDGTYEITATAYQYFVLGNPYPSALDAEKFLADNADVLNQTIYYYDSTNDYSHYYEHFAGGYATWVGQMGNPAPTYIDGKENSTKTPGRYIPVGQGFLMYSKEEGQMTDNTIEFNNSQRVFAIRGNDSEFIARGANVSKSSASSFPILRLGLEFLVEGKGKRKRTLTVGFNGKTNDYEDGFDAYMFDKQPTDLGLKIITAPNEPLVISTIENFSKEIEIPLELYVDSDRTVTFKTEELKNFPETDIYLKDAQTNQFYNLSTTNVSVSMSLAQGNYLDRFSIVFKNEANSLSTENIETTTNFNAFVDAKTNEIVVKQYQEEEVKNLKVYNLLGKEVASFTSNSNSKELRLQHNLKASVYILKIKTTNGEDYSKKIIIQ